MDFAFVMTGDRNEVEQNTQAVFKLTVIYTVQYGCNENTLKTNLAWFLPQFSTQKFVNKQVF